MIHRLERIQRLMKEKGIDLCHVTGDSHLFYLTGKSISYGDLWITREKGVLFVDDRYFEMLSHLSHLEVRRLGEEKAFLIPFRKSLAAMNGGSLTYRTFQEKKEFFEKEPLDFDPVLLVRLIKEEGEIALIKEGTNLTREGIAFVISRLKEGVVEEEIAREFEFFVRGRGASGLSFSPIIAFGPSSAFPHYRAGERALLKQDSVIIDVGVKWKGYASDLTRMAVIGKESKKHHQAYHAVIHVHDELVKALKVGMRVQDFHLLARTYLTNEGYGDHIRHGIGHFIGIDTHEGYSFSKAKEETFQEGMVLTIEPGLYFPGEFGIRYENTFVLRKEGLEEL